MSEINENKRALNSESDSDSEGVVGPSLSEASQPKKRKILPFERLYLDNLPCSESYEKSYMHRDVITHCVVTSTDFIVTASCDGHIKFWKKVETGIEFVKHFRSHLGPITSIACNAEGSLLCSASSDKSLKIFDVMNFDMINMMKLEYTPSTVEWVHGPGDAVQCLAVSDLETPAVYVYDGRGNNVPLKVLEKLHTKPVAVMRYNVKYDAMISVDKNGILGKISLVFVMCLFKKSLLYVVLPQG